MAKTLARDCHGGGSEGGLWFARFQRAWWGLWLLTFCFVVPAHAQDVAPVGPDDRQALRVLGDSLPSHAIMPMSAPSPTATDGDWQLYAQRLLFLLAPESLRPAERRQILQARPLAPAVAHWAPTHRRYRALQAELKRQLLVGAAVLPEIPETRFRFAAGITAPEVALLRDRLLAEGYGDPAVKGAAREYFDPDLRRAMQRWQRAQGLPITVVVDPLTRRRLNEKVVPQISELVLALQRFRRLEWRHDHEKIILVHINEYVLSAEEGGQVALTMPVVVGKNTEEDRTPILSSQLKQIIANPSWGVPWRIVNEGLKPGVGGDPARLVEKGYEVRVDASGQWRVRMWPGRQNPLGKMKFPLEDTNGIYLHGTQAPSAFSRDARSLSHGCVRLSEPLALAKWLMPTRALDLDEAVAYETLTTQFSPEPIGVHLMYQSLLIEDGAWVRSPDIYRWDKAELEAIDEEALVTALTPYLR